MMRWKASFATYGGNPNDFVCSILQSAAVSPMFFHAQSFMLISLTVC
jgi:hypothetical protein